MKKNQYAAGLLEKEEAKERKARARERARAKALLPASTEEGEMAPSPALHVVTLDPWWVRPFFLGVGVTVASGLILFGVKRLLKGEKKDRVEVKEKVTAQVIPLNPRSEKP